MTRSDPDGDDVASIWLRDHAHRLRTLDPADTDVTDLAPLREIVGDARVVAIGESMHRVHEFCRLRDRVLRFLVTELGFSAFVMESGLPESLAVNDWILGAPGDLTQLLSDGLTYHFGKCAEMRDQLVWMRARNADQEQTVRFYGMDVSGSSATALPAVGACASFLDDVDPAYAACVRARLLPLLDYPPADRSGIAWAAPAIHAYLALAPSVRYEITARIGELAERLQAQRIVYADRAGDDRAELAIRCAIIARHTDAFLAAMADGAERSYTGANIRDAAMAETVEWILAREDRVVLAAATGHIQRWPYSVPPIIAEPLTTAGQHLARALGDDMVVIGSTFGTGHVWLHQPHPDDPPGHSRPFIGDPGPHDPHSLDALLTIAGIEHYLLDLRTVPADGAIAERFAAVTSTMNGPHPQPIDALTAFDAVIHVDTISPWHTFIDTPG